MRKLFEGEHKVDEREVIKVLSDSELSKSGKMKRLFDLGLDVREIHKEMKVRYNFVYNVISNYVNTNAIPVETAERGAIKKKIEELYRQGKTNKEIAIELRTNHNYVYGITKALKDAEKKEAAE